MQIEEKDKYGHKPTVAVSLIIGRYLVAFGLSTLPIIIGLKNDWYIMLLVVFNFIVQFGLASIHMTPYFKQISKYHK